MLIIRREFIYPVENRPVNACHASTLVMLPDGDILAAWFGGEHEGAENVEIWSSRRHENVWTEPVMMSEQTDKACWNPVLYTEGNDVTLFFKRGDRIFRWQTFVRRSHDGGLTWSGESELVNGDAGGRGPVKNKPVGLSDGSLLAPGSHESEDGRTWIAFTDRSEDGGLTWIRSEYIKTDPYAQLIQPTLWESVPGSVHMLLRSAENFIYRADSDDYGHTWNAAYPTGLPNNNSGIDLVKTPDGMLALVCNPVGSNHGKRTPLVLITSADNGMNWGEPLYLAGGEGEYSYPAVICADGRLYITFTWQRKSVMYCEVSL